MIKIGLVDDHILLRSALASVILQSSGKKYMITLEVANGKSLIDSLIKIEKDNIPDIILLGINMPEMNGFETVKWIQKNAPQLKIIILASSENADHIIRMTKIGVNGYLLKSGELPELLLAIDSVWEKELYYSGILIKTLVNEIKNKPEDLFTQNSRDNSIISQKKSIDVEMIKNFSLTDREIEMLKLCCTELTYKEIAEQMEISPRTVDAFRDSLFEKLRVKTRVGLVIFAMKNNLVNNS